MTRRTRLTLQLAGLLITLFGLAAPVSAKSYTLVVQPILTEAQTRAAYEPLANYLTNVTGHQFELKTVPTFLEHSYQQSEPGFADFILDAAHFTGFRCRDLRFQAIAKISGQVSYTVVTRPDVDAIDPNDLLGKRVAVISAPSIASVRFTQVYPGLFRQPRMVPTESAQSALARLKSGDVDGALVPTPLLNAHPNLTILQQTEPNPHMGFSVAPWVPADVANAVREALLDAPNSKAGQAMLAKIKLPGFEPANNAVYLPFAGLLERTWQKHVRRHNAGAPASAGQPTNARSSDPKVDALLEQLR